MIEQLLLSVAVDELDKAMEVATREGLGIEVTLYNTDWLMEGGALEDAERARERFEKRGLTITAHGPLYDLNPGSLDPTIRSYTRDCFLRGIEVGAALGAKKIVYHTFFNPLLPRGVLPGWKRLAKPTWAEAREAAADAGITICLENSYEPTAEFFSELFEEFGSDSTRMCYDPAHVHLYSRDGQPAWVANMGHKMSHLHLNDNDGASDDHKALGEGEIPYKTILTELCGACDDATVVLEMSIDRALGSLGFLRAVGMWE